MISTNLAIVLIGMALVIGDLIGMFIVACFAVRNYNRGFKDGFRESELEKIKKGDILHAG